MVTNVQSETNDTSVSDRTEEDESHIQKNFNSDFNLRILSFKVVFFNGILVLICTSFHQNDALKLISNPTNIKFQTFSTWNSASSHKTKGEIPSHRLEIIRQTGCDTHQTQVMTFRMIFPVLLFIFAPLIFRVRPGPALSAPLSSAGHHTKGPVRQSNQELPWMAGAHISQSHPSTSRSLQIHLAVMIEERAQAGSRTPKTLLGAENHDCEESRLPCWKSRPRNSWTKCLFSLQHQTTNSNKTKKIF